MQKKKKEQAQPQNYRLRTVMGGHYEAQLTIFIAHLRRAPKSVQAILAPYAVYLADEELKLNKSIRNSLEHLKKIQPLVHSKMNQVQKTILAKIMEMLNLQKLYQLVCQNDKCEKSFNSFLKKYQQERDQAACSYKSTIKIDLVRPEYFLHEMLAKHEGQTGIGERFTLEDNNESIFYKQPRFIDKIAELCHLRENQKHRGNIALFEYNGNFIIGRRAYAIAKDNYFEIWQKTQKLHPYPFPGNPLCFQDHNEQFKQLVARSKETNLAEKTDQRRQEAVQTQPVAPKSEVITVQEDIAEQKLVQKLRPIQEVVEYVQENQQKMEEKRYQQQKKILARQGLLESSLSQQVRPQENKPESEWVGSEIMRSDSDDCSAYRRRYRQAKVNRKELIQSQSSKRSFQSGQESEYVQRYKQLSLEKEEQGQISYGLRQLKRGRVPQIGAYTDSSSEEEKGFRRIKSKRQGKGQRRFLESRQREKSEEAEESEDKQKKERQRSLSEQGYIQEQAQRKGQRQQQEVIQKQGQKQEPSQRQKPRMKQQYMQVQRQSQRKIFRNEQDQQILQQKSLRQYKRQQEQQQPYHQQPQQAKQYQQKQQQQINPAQQPNQPLQKSNQGIKKQPETTKKQIQLSQNSQWDSNAPKYKNVSYNSQISLSRSSESPPPESESLQYPIIQAQLPKTTALERSFKFIGHTNKITCASFSQDEYYIITGSVDSSIKLWCLRLKILLASFHCHIKTVWDVHFNPSGLYFLSGGADGLMLLWKTDHPKPQRIFTNKSDVYKVHFARNPNFAVSGGEEGILRIWNIIKAEVIKEIKTDKPIINFNLGHSGVYILVVQTDGRVTLHNVHKGILLASFYFYYKNLGESQSKRQAIHDVCFSQDEKTISCVTVKQILVYSMQSLQMSRKKQSNTMQIEGLLKDNKRQSFVAPQTILMSYDDLRFTYCRYRNRGMLLIGGTRYKPV